MKPLLTPALGLCAVLLGGFVATGAGYAQDANSAAEEQTEQQTEPPVGDAVEEEAQSEESAGEAEQAAQEEVGESAETLPEAPPTAAPVVPLPFLDLRRVAPVVGDAAAGREKSTTCGTCHGNNGISIGPAIPHIAGQSVDYLYWELVQFHRGDFPAMTMTAMVPKTLSDQDLRDMAAYYASLPANGAASNPIALPAPDPQVLAKGEQLYMHGDSQKGIPPCQGCHGVDARGQRDAQRRDRSGNLPYAHYPALRGQPQTYLTMRMSLLHDEAMNNSSSEQIMAPISKRLDTESIEALAAWLGHLPR